MGTSFWDLVEKEKKKRFGLNSGLNINNTPTYIPTGDFGELVKQHKFKSSPYTAFEDEEEEEEDIAPVKTIGTSRSFKKESEIDLFDKGALGKIDITKQFDDGYQFGDVVKTVGNVAGNVGKAILGTAGDTVLSWAKGPMKLGEGLGQAISYGIAGIGEAIGQDEWAADVRERASEGLVDQLLQPAEEYLDQYSVLGRTTQGVAQGIGQFQTLSGLGEIATGLGVGTKGVTAVTSGTMGISGVGSGISEAYQGGATDEEALKYGLGAGASEVVWEMMFGGMGKAINAVGFNKGVLPLDDMAAKAVSKFLSSQNGKNIVQALVKGGFEGFEELGTGFTQAALKKMTYMSEKEFGKILEDENLFEQFIIGTLTSDISQVGSVRAANKAGVDYVTGYTQDEQDVVDKATEALISAREQKYGRELTNKEKTEARKEIKENLEHGGLDIDSIAEFLGGESYEAFKAESDSFFGSDAYKAFEEAERNEKLLPELQEKYDKLHSIMPEKKTGAQQNEEASLLEQINAIKNAPKSSDLKAKLDPVANKRLIESYKKMHQDTLARVKDSRLAESYREYERSQQKLDIDVSKYTDENARKTVQAIIDSGLGDNSNAFKHFVDFMAKIAADKKTIGFDLTNNQRLFGTEHSRAGLTTNGYKLTDENGVTIVINKDAANPLRTVVGHEFTHALEGMGDLYSAVADSVMKYAETKEGLNNLNARIKEAERIYKGDKNTTPEKEVVADLIGEYVFSDYDFIMNLANTNHKGFMKLFDEVKYLARIATAGSKEARELAKVKNNFERAYREYNGAGRKTESDSGNTQTEGFTGSYTGTKYTAEQADLLAAVSAEGMQNATDLAGRQDVTFNHIGINDKQTQQKWIDAGLASMEQGADGNTYVAVNDAMLMDERERRQKNTANKSGVQHSYETVDGIGYVKAEKNIFIKEDGTTASEREVFDSLAGKTIPFPDGEIEIVSGLPGKNMYKELFTRYPKAFGGVDDIKQLNSDVNYNMKELLANSTMKDPGVPDHDNRHQKQGITHFDSRTVKFYDGNKAYNIQFNIGILQDGRKVAYAKKFFGYDEELTKKIQAAEAGSRKSSENQQPVSGTKVAQNEPNVKTQYSLSPVEAVELHRQKDADVQHSYSKPDFNKEEWAIVNRRKHSEFDNPKYDLDNGNKWMYANEKGYTVFAVYSKYDPEDPTVLYGSSGKAAARDYAIVVAHQQGGTNANRGRTTLDRLLAYLESNEVQRNNGFAYPKGTLPATEDVPLPFGESGSNGRGDYSNGGNNLQESELTKYDDEASGEPGASITFSNDYAAYRNFMKEGDTGETDIRFSLSKPVANQFDASKEQSAESKFLKYTRGAGRRSSFAARLADLAPVREDVAETAIETAETEQNVPIAENVAPVTALFPDNLPTIDEELDSLLQQQEVLESRMQEAMAEEDVDAFAQVSAEYDSVMARLDELEHEAATMDADKLDSLNDADVPPVRETEWLERADTVPLTKKAAADIAREVRQKLGLSNKQMYDVYMLIEEYSKSEFPDREQLFRDIKEKFGTYTESEFDETVKDAKTYLRTNGLFVSDSIKKEIADYAHLMKKNRGRIHFSKDGTEVDVLYHELNALYPHLFPESIINPTDQLMQMVDVANMDAETTVEMDLPDEAIWDVVDAVTSGVSNYQQSQKQKASNKSSRESFNSLMKNADEYAPPVEEDDIAPVGVAPVESVEPAVDDMAPTIEDVKTEGKTAPAEAVAVDEDGFISQADKPTTANERLAKKLSNYQNELAENQRLREQSNADYDSEIARLQAEYDAKKNKRSMAAHDLLRRIERVKRMKNNVDADYAKRISDLGKRIEKLNTKEAKTAAQRQTKMEQHTEKWKNLIGDTSTWKDLALGLSYKTKTLRRILRKVVRDANGNPDIALADQIYDELETKYDHNEALLKRESQKLKEVFQKLKLNHAEDAYAHMLGELRHNPDTALTPDVVKEYYNKHKGKIDVKKVDTAINEARKTFDDLIIRVNTALRDQGFKEIPYRKGYFPHFTNPKQGWLAKLLNWKTIDTEVPTSIAGLTEAFEPQRSWQSFNKERKGDTTDYSLYQGLDTYIHGALDWIYHIDDLQSRRALENHIRYVHSEEGIKARIDEIKANEDYDADEAQEMIDAVLKEANNPLSGLVRELMNRTNTLANKKSSMDRGMEDATNRKIYSTMTNLNNRINANMVVGSLSSALTNFIPMVQSWHQVSPYFTVRGLGDYVRSVVKDDGMIAKSDFLTNRLIEEEKLYQTGWDKVSDKAAFMMNVIDSITSQTVWRSKYLQNLKEGMSETQAIKDADQFAKNLMAGRSRGNAPSIFDAKNPVVKLFTAFQLEVANQYGYMFDDVVKDTKNPVRLVKGYATAFLGAYLYNTIYSSLVGRDAAFDPIGIIEDLLRDLGVGDDDEEEEEPKEIISNLAENIVQEVPFLGGLIGGGRVPLSSALPYSSDSTPFASMLNDVSEGNWNSFGKEFLKPLYYLAMPVGGGQIKKAVEGLGMFSDEHPVAGSYTDSGKLRFPVEDTIGNRVQAAMFGQYASENARYYFDNDIAPLGEKQIQEYQDVDIPIRDYWDYRKGLKGLDTLEEKLGYISSLDLPTYKKNILANNLTDRKEDIDMGEYGDYSSLEEYDYSQTNKDMYDFLQSQGVSNEEYDSFDEDTKDAYRWAAKNPEKFTMSKAIASDLVVYRQYASDLYDLKADKDANGKSISGSRKAKVLDYINNLDAEYGEKIILYKSEYPADDTYNAEIVEYLNNRDDISYEEMVTILNELGFTVLEDGRVLWD